MPRKVAVIHKRISERKPGDLLAWWKSLTPEQRKHEKQKQYLRVYATTKRGKAAQKKYAKTPKWKAKEEKYKQRKKRKAARSESARKAAAAKTPEQRSESARKAAAKLTPEQRSERSRKSAAKRTPEQRSESARKREAAKTPEQRSERASIAGKASATKLTPEQRSERSRKASAKQTPEQRSQSARKRQAAKTPEQRSEISRKASAKQTPKQRSQRQIKAGRSRRRNLVKDVIYIEKLPKLNLLSKQETGTKFNELTPLIQTITNRFRRRTDFEDITSVVNLAVADALSKWDKQRNLQQLVTDSTKLHLIDYFGPLKKWNIREIPIDDINRALDALVRRRR